MKKLLICTFIILLNACKDNLFENEPAVIYGYFYEDCNAKPIVGLPLDVFALNQNGLTSSTNFLGSVITDEKGYISFELGRNGPLGVLLFKRKDGFTFLRVGSNTQNVVYFNSVSAAKVKHNIILKVDSPLTVMDTLIVQAQANDTLLKLPGPFFNGQTIPLTINPNLVSGGEQIYIPRVETIYFYWGIGIEDFANRASSPAADKKAIINVKQNVCGLGDNVIIDVNKQR